MRNVRGFLLSVIYAQWFNCVKILLVLLNWIVEPKHMLLS